MSNKFTLLPQKQEQKQPELFDDRQAIAITDPCSTGAIVAKYVKEFGYKCICIHSNAFHTIASTLPIIDNGVVYDATIENGNSNYKIDDSNQNLSIIETEDQILDDITTRLEKLPYHVIAIIAGSESGVYLADMLSEKLGLQTNHSLHSDVRRNKFLMGDRIKKCGIRSLHQVVLDGNCWKKDEAKIDEILKEIININKASSSSLTPSSFSDNDNDMININITQSSNVQQSMEDQLGMIQHQSSQEVQVVIKPIDSAGSVGVYLCSNKKEIEKYYNELLESNNVFGEKNVSLLLQEYAMGDEYVVDTVSQNGIHKVVAVWRYDKRPINGRDFVCHGQELLSMSDPWVQELCQYQRAVNDALFIQNGPAHSEIKIHHGKEPVLIETGARCHGADGCWHDVANYCLGYNQAEVAVDCYLENSKRGIFQQIPMDIPDKLLYNGRVLFLMSFVEGKLIEINQAFIKEIQKMESFIDIQFLIHEKDTIKKTVDCISFVGWVLLCHELKEIVKSNYDRIREMEESGLFFMVV